MEDKDTGVKILTILLHSHLNNIGNPGSFNEETNHLLKLNKLPAIILPNNPNSSAILNTTTSTSTDGIEIRKEDDKLDEETNHERDEEDNNENKEDMPPLEQISGKDIGLQIITKNNVGWPRNVQTNLRKLTEGIESGTYKWTYNDNSYPEETIYRCLQNKEINFDSCWYRMEDSKFNKIRNGLQTDNTPPSEKTSKPRPRR